MYGRDLLGLFGSIYTVGYAALVVYLGGVFIGSAVGATGWLLMITDHQYARMILDWLLATFNVALTYAFVLRFGLVGAALGTSLAIAVQNRIQALLLRWFEGLWSFDRAFLTPVAAGFAMVVVGWTIRISSRDRRCSALLSLSSSTWVRSRSWGSIPETDSSSADSPPSIVTLSSTGSTGDGASVTKVVPARNAITCDDGRHHRRPWAGIYTIVSERVMMADAFVDDRSQSAVTHGYLRCGRWNNISPQ